MPNNSIISEQSGDDLVFVGVLMSGKTFNTSDYYHCKFRNCHFDDANLKEVVFDSCSFEHCNFNNAIMTDCTIKECEFLESTAVGIDFTKLRTGLGIEISFDHCNLSFSNFGTLRLSGSKFVHCNLEEVDFTETDLSNSSLSFSDLTRAIFHYTKLRKADFRGAKNYYFDPKVNFIKDAVFSEPDVKNLLLALDIRIEEPPEDDTAI